jgi:predicted HTH transcriptional regulator
MRQTPKITIENLANILSVSRKTISRDVNYMLSNGLIEREGGDKGGIWIVKE